jgi:DNA replication protein DnaC
MIAYLACRAMVDDQEHQVSLHRLAQYHLRLYPKSSPDWVHKALAAPDKPRCGVVLWGDYGVGKTWLAAATMNALAQLNSYVLYVRMGDLLQSLRDSWYGDEKTNELLQKYTEATVLFIDDMSDSSRDDAPLPVYQQEYAAAIMRKRMGNHSPTIVTTNWGKELFEAKWGSVCTEVMRQTFSG